MKQTSILWIIFYILLCAVSAPSWAVLTVSNTNDSGSGSLRQAVNDAIISPGDDTIEFNPALTGQTILLSSGPIEIGNVITSADGVVTINGLGADKLTISASNNSRAFIVSDLSQLVINHLTITDTTPSSIRVDDYYSDTKLTLNNCIITHNDNAGTQNAAIEAFGDVEINHCTLSSNNSVAISDSVGILRVTNSEITNNTGGGIFAGVDTHESDDGGSSVTVSDSVISNNNGNGIFATEGYLQLSKTTISHNQGTAIEVILGGDADIQDSTLVNNGQGIAFFGELVNEDTGNASASLTISNTTISGNGDTTVGGGIHIENLGGPIGDSVKINVILTNTTITNNSATEQGGGILVDPDPADATTTVTLNNTIIAGNHAPNNPDVAGNFISNGFNVIGDAGSSNGLGADIIEADVTKILQTALNDNGGATKTHLLVAGSPAIDAGGTDCPDADQRGVSRPQGKGCDIGAVELKNIPEPPVGALQCEIRTDYAAGICSGKFNVFSLADLDAYTASNFGKDLTGHYQNLGIKASLGSPGDSLDIESPCRIIVSPGVSLTGDFVSLDGRKGVWSTHTTVQSAGAACLLSETKNVKFKANSKITAKQLVLEANTEAKIGYNSQVNVSDSLTIRSTGTAKSSRAIVGHNSTLTVGTEMTVSSHFRTTIQKSTQVDVGGDLTVEALGSIPNNRAVIGRSSNLSVGADMLLSGGSRAIIQKNASIDATGNLEMNALQLNHCGVSSTASISFARKSGVCVARLP